MVGDIQAISRYLTKVLQTNGTIKSQGTAKQDNQLERNSVFLRLLLDVTKAITASLNTKEAACLANPAQGAGKIGTKFLAGQTGRGHPRGYENQGPFQCQHLHGAGHGASGTATKIFLKLSSFFSSRHVDHHHAFDILLVGWNGQDIVNRVQGFSSHD